MCSNGLAAMQVFVEELELAGMKARNVVLVVMDIEHAMPVFNPQFPTDGPDYMEALRRALGELGSLVGCSAGEEDIPLVRDLVEVIRIYG